MNFIILVVLIAALAASDAVQAKLPMRRGFHDRQRNQGGKYGGQRMSYAEAARAQHRNHENIGAARAQHENIAARLQEMNLENQVRGQQYDDGYDYVDLDTITQDIKDIQARLDALERINNLALFGSCAELKAEDPTLPSGFYGLLIDGEMQYVFCSMDELCGDDGGWLRVGALDTSNPEEFCPGELQALNANGVRRACGRSPGDLCQSVNFETFGTSYTKICGRVTGYQVGSTDGLEIHSVGQRDNIEAAYVDGVSITRGNPRQHIFTYVSSIQESYRWCPCDANSAARPLPGFIDDDYYCETGVPVPGSWSFTTFYTDDLLWDGQQCASTQQACCDAAAANPWFSKVLSEPTTDFIELRVCGDEPVGNENVGVNFYEIYIK